VTGNRFVSKLRHDVDMTNHPVTSVTVARATRLLGVPLIAVLLAGCGALGGRR
jgi:hypothetical protein